MKYDRMTIALHWITAALVATAWLLAQVIDVFAAQTWQVAMGSTHISLGVLLIAVLAVRVLWRRIGGATLPAFDPGWQGKAATAMHHLLYLAVAVLLLGGLANLWARGASIYGLFEVPALFANDRAIRRLIGGLHELAANAVLILAGLHAAMALVHHYVLKDGVLRRMLPSA
jgi:cytochrome b561